jgi:hypothetical protein
MGGDNNLIIFLAFSVFTCFVGFTLYYYWQGDKLFKLLADRHPKYYKANKEPMYFSDPLSNLWASLFLMLLLIKGLPKDFPKDADAHILATRSRKIGASLLLSLAVILAFIYYQIIIAR